MKNRIQQPAQTNKAGTATRAQGFIPGWPKDGARELYAEQTGNISLEIGTTGGTPEPDTLCSHALVGQVKLSRWDGIRATVDGVLCELGNIAVGDSDMLEVHRPITDAEARAFLLARSPMIARLFGTPEGAKA